MCFVLSFSITWIVEIMISALLLMKWNPWLQSSINLCLPLWILKQIWCTGKLMHIILPRTWVKNVASLLLILGQPVLLLNAQMFLRDYPRLCALRSLLEYSFPIVPCKTILLTPNSLSLSLAQFSQFYCLIIVHYLLHPYLLGFIASVL